MTQKIFVLSSKHPYKHAGGMATVVVSLCQCLKLLGHHPHLITFSTSGKLTVKETPLATIHEVPSRIQFLGTVGFPFQSRAFAKYIDHVIQDQKVDRCLIHSHAPWAIPAALLKKKYGADRVISVNHYATTIGNEVYWLMRGARIRDYGLPTKMKYLLIHAYTAAVLTPSERWALKAADAITLSYDSVENLLMREYGLSWDKLYKIPLHAETYVRGDQGAAPEPELALPRTLSRPIFMAVCRQEGRKGINYLLRAARILKDRGLIFSLVVVGPGDLLEKNKRLARRLGVADVVHFTGFVPDVAPYLEKADVFVVAALQEGSGSASAMEAMCRGIPVISTNIDGMPEDIHHGLNGLLVPPADEMALANAMRQMAQDEGMRDRMGKNIRETYCQRFGLEAMAQGLKEVYAAFGF